MKNTFVKMRISITEKSILRTSLINAKLFEKSKNCRKITFNILCRLFKNIINKIFKKFSVLIQKCINNSIQIQSTTLIGIGTKTYSINQW